MKILLIADTHSVRHEEWQGLLKTNPSSFDFIAILGDVEAIFMRQLGETFPKKRIIGVLGNHDKKGKFDFYNIENIHGKIVEIDGVKVAGLEGSVRYKDNEKFPLYTQFEIINICKNLDYADIIISHNSPLGIHDSYNTDRDIAHLGFQGLLYYIKDKKPIYCIHGHQHINKLTKIEGVNVLGVHGASILDLDLGEIIRIF